jgi:hypothetical protein
MARFPGTTALSCRLNFEAWVAKMNHALDRFFARLPEDVRARLDFSPASLDALEAWILNRYAKSVEMRTGDEIPNLDGIARYIGQTIIKALGGTGSSDSPIARMSTMAFRR